MVRQRSNYEGNINPSSSSNSDQAGTAIPPVEGDSPSDGEVTAPGLFSDLPEEYRIGIRSYLWETLCSILTDLLKHSRHHTTEPQEYLLLLKQAIVPAYHQLLRYLSTMYLFATRYAQEKRGIELSQFAMQLALELYWNIRRHVERGGGGQQILEIVDISRMPVAQAAHRPPGPPHLSPIQPWKTPNLHRERLIAHARGANADRGELRTNTGLPHFAGHPLDFRHPKKYGSLPLGSGGLSCLLGPEVARTLKKKNKLETEGKGRDSAWLRVTKCKVRAQAHRRRVRTRERVTIAQHRKAFRRISYLGGPKKNNVLQLLRSPDLISLRKQRRLSKANVRHTIRSVDEKSLEAKDQGQVSSRGERKGQSQSITEGGEGRVLCDDGDTDSDDIDDSGEGDEYFEDTEDGREGDCGRNRNDMEHSNEHEGEDCGVDDDDWGDDDCDTPSVFHVEDSKPDKSVRSRKPSQVEGDGDSAVGEWVANVEELIKIQTQKEIRKRERAMKRLRGARERLRCDPKFRQLPNARRRWVAVEPSARPTDPETGSLGELFTTKQNSKDTSRNMPIIIRSGFDGLSNHAKDAVLEMPSVGKSSFLGPSKNLPSLVPGISTLTVMLQLQSHQAEERPDPPPAPRPQHAAPPPSPRPQHAVLPPSPRPQHAVPLPVSAPLPAAFTQPMFRSPYTHSSPPTPLLRPSRPLPLATQSASLAPLPSATQNTPLPASAPSPAAFSQPSFRSPYVQSSSPSSQSIPSLSASRTIIPSSTQYPPPASTPSSSEFSQSSFSYPYALPSAGPQSSIPPSYPSTHHHPPPASVPTSATFSQPFFVSPSPYAQYSLPQPQSITSSTLIPSSSQLPPPT